MSSDASEQFALASEREALENFLDAQREGLIRKIEGLDDSTATELILTALELPDVQRSWFPYVPPIVGTIGSGETPAATAWATVRTSAR